LIAVVSDDFNYCALDPAWQFIDPLNDSDYTLTTTQLDFMVPAGTAHDIWPEQGKPLIRTPRMMRSITDPNNLQVKFDSGVNEEVGFQGVLFEQDENNVFRVSYQFKNAQTELYIIGHRGAQNAKIFKKINVNGASADGPLYIRTTRESGRWNVSYSTNGTGWTDAGTFDFPLSVTKAGVFAGNVSGPETIPAVKAQVDYWFNADSPLNPEDDAALILPVNIQGNGSVAKNVECGNPVTLTAVPAAGWQFVNWAGSPIDGQTNPEITTSFQFGDQVIAVFEEIGDGPFTLGTSVIGQGVISKNPDKSEYENGESVTLTAQPGAGWTFDHWEGALTGDNETQILTMDANKNVTAVFVEQVGFDLQVDVVGSGKVIASPEKLLYDPGESVLLIAFSDPGWRFDRWEGAVTSETNRISITMTQNTVVTAIFEQAQQEIFTVHLPFINH
jgi:hypothetical protein